MAVTFEDIFIFMDPLLIVFYRIFENPAAGFFFGTFMLSLFCIILGRMTSAIIYRINRGYYLDLAEETQKMHDLSLMALRLKDKETYKALNKEANDAFGRYFFSQLAMGACMLWPIPFALGWMDTRFAELGFVLPIVGGNVRYIFIFIMFYIVSRLLFSKL
jgi:hypothetical protein